jgi:hypothetical protein
VGKNVCDIETAGCLTTYRAYLIGARPMTLTDEERAYLLGSVNALMHDTEAVLRYPRITEDEWSRRFAELPHPDDDSLYQPLEDTPANRAILSARDPRLTWSVIPEPGGDVDSYLIVPGFWPQMAEGWHLTAIPWNPAAHVIGYFKRGC